MASELSIDNLFEEHSLEDIESIRDNLANEIEKRTEQLKAIVKGKYRDIVETSDAILAMQDKLEEIKSSIESMDDSIGKFFDKVREPTLKNSDKLKSDSPKINSDRNPNNANNETDELIRELIHYSSQIRVHSEENNLLESVDSLNRCFDIINNNQHKFKELNHFHILSGIKIGLNRSRDMLKKSVWYTILKAGPESIGIIAEKGQTNIFELSLDAALDFLTADFCTAISDMSFEAQLKRYQPQVAFNTATNEIDFHIQEVDVNLSTHVLIPKLISPELSHYLFRVCKAINTISGSNRDHASVIHSLKATISNIMQVYFEILPIASALKADNKRRRCLQLYFDLLYTRTILNNSKSIELIELLDPHLIDLSQNYERLVDPVELFMITKGIQTNVIDLAHQTIRLYALLIPTLE